MISSVQVKPGTRELETWLRAEWGKGAWVEAPLPTTRELGARFGMSHTTAFRILCRLEVEGLFLRNRAGRFFHSDGKERLARRAPIACLFRRIESWSLVYQGIMNGIAQVCDEARAATLLWHDVKLVRHENRAFPPVFAGPDEQRQVMETFLDRCGESVDSVILDHLWDPAAETMIRKHGLPVVTVYRSSPGAAGTGRVAADFRAGATAALAHLLGRGYQSLYWVTPFEGDSAVQTMKAAFLEGAESLGIRDRVGGVLDGSTPGARENLAEKIARERHRVGLFCPEDNVSVLVRDALRQRGISLPGQAGLLSGMGTETALAAGISSVRYDFAEMGRAAARQLTTRATGSCRLAPSLQEGTTT